VSLLDDQRLLLDTHVFVWLLTGSPQLHGSPARTLIEQASQRDGLYVSAISIWELVAMEKAGFVRFSVSTDAWIRDATETPGVQTLPVDRDIAAEAAGLPEPFEGDFVDRAIVATARLLNCVVVTADAQMLAYAERGYVRATDVR
jgi:PIN domain nuclease of toxin-antitoxin system